MGNTTTHKPIRNKALEVYLWTISILTVAAVVVVVVL